LPGAAIGVLGGGQLGRMCAFTARRMGYRVHTLAPEAHTPTAQVADAAVVAPYEDLDAVRAFARGVQVVTLEFENIPASTLAAVADLAPLRPGPLALHTAQHRLREKEFLARSGFPVAPFHAVRSAADLRDAARHVPFPAILKTASLGYDGKGQAPVASPDDLDAAFAALGGRESVLEARVDLALEFSVVAARGVDGAKAAYQPIQNRHERGILDLSVTPAAVAPGIARDALEIARGVLDGLDVVGVLCVEFFLARDGRLLVNELAPRPHNSGHLTIEAAATSQFEQQVRAACGLPLGATDVYGSAAMANLLGDLWATGEPRWAAACAVPGVALHLYGKDAAHPGRKMGHLTALAGDPDAAAHRVLRARAALTPDA